MPEAARLGDPIGHSPTMSWLLKGLLIGAGIALVGVAIVGTGGLAAVAIVGGAAAAGAGIGEVMSTMSFAPKEVVGQIIEGSRNVYIRGKKAARAHVDHAECSKHPQPPKVIATGSGNVYINGMPAARVGDKTECGAEITAGAGNVFIGGGTQQTDAISPENLVPGWVHAALLVVGLGSAVILAGPIIAVGGLVGGTLGGIGGSWVGGQVFGEGSDGQKWSMLGGSVVGGYVGAKGASGAWNAATRAELVPSAVETKFGPLNQGPLAQDVANTFRSGTYTGRTLSSDQTLYRVISDNGNPTGRYWTSTKPEGPLQSVIDSALDPNWGNTATRVVTANVPAGTTIYEGAAAAQRGLVGGGNQIYIPKVDPSWIVP
jgi:uncharacterized Zn-binding protein involved in type VI secretion